MTADFTDLGVWWREYAGAYAERNGFLVECVRQFGMEAVGVEGAEDALAECRARHPRADVRAWSAGTPLPVTSESIGVAVAHEVIDHITLEDSRALFGELWRVLKPDGVVVVKSPSRYNTADQDKGHVTFFSPSEFRGFLRSCQFGVVEQPYMPRPMLGRGRLGWLAMQGVTKLWPREEWAARIDLVASRLPR